MVSQLQGGQTEQKGHLSLNSEEPVGILITDSDVLYISDSYNHRIVVVHLDSTSNNYTIGSGQGAGLHQFYGPRDVAVFNASLYVVDTDNFRLQKMSLNGSNPTTAANLTGMTAPLYLSIDHSGNIYVSVRLDHCVWLLPSNSTARQVIAGHERGSGSGDHQFNEPYGIFVNDVRTIYVADRWNHRIMKWLHGASSGVRVAGDGISGSSSTRLDQPTQVIVDRNEYMYI